MTISKELLDELLSGVENADDLLGDKGLIKELKVRLMERMLGAELTAHLGYEPHGEPARQQSNRRNGATRIKEKDENVIRSLTSKLFRLSQNLFLALLK